MIVVNVCMLEFFKEVNVVKLIKGLEDKLCID